jgi:predicted SAM-dependent methyltransferase
MREQSKAAIRRKQDWRFANRWLVGRGIDLGAGDDPLLKEDWPKVTEIRAYDVAFGDKDAQFLPEIADEEFDFVHSSHCLEHLRYVRAALVNWLRVVKKGGFVIVTVPDSLLYEAGNWPSRFNSDHKASFTMRGIPIIPTSINVLHLLWKLSNADVEHVTLLTEGWTMADIDRDQTQLGRECSIEFVIRKFDAKRPF